MPHTFFSLQASNGNLSGACRVRKCRSYGKRFLDLYRHVRVNHPTVRYEDHQKLPAPSTDDIIKGNNKPYMKYRKQEVCTIDGCSKQGQFFKDLTRHLKTKHQLTREQYERYGLHCHFFVAVPAANVLG